MVDTSSFAVDVVRLDYRFLAASPLGADTPFPARLIPRDEAALKFRQVEGQVNPGLDDFAMKVAIPIHWLPGCQC